MQDLKQQALELCWEIEKFPPSKHQTATVLKASALHQALCARASPAIADGFVMVPKEMTYEMERVITRHGLSNSEKRDIWEAWLAAAPKVAE